MKRRLEKKYIKRHVSMCADCYRDCVYLGYVETRLESSRRRRIRSEQKRVRRRDVRQSPLKQWLLKEMTKAYHEEMEKMMTAFIGEGLRGLGFDMNDEEWDLIEPT